MEGLVYGTLNLIIVMNKAAGIIKIQQLVQLEIVCGEWVIVSSLGVIIGIIQIAVHAKIIHLI
jgi:hypothetical protein